MTLFRAGLFIKKLEKNMIFDQMKNFAKYAPLAPAVWGKVEAFIAGTATLPDGRYEIAGSEVFATIDTHKIAPLNPDRLEYHRDYVDIQLLLEGEEDFIYAPIDGLAVTREYRPDAGLCRLDGPGLALKLVPGNFAVLFPEEGHAPGVGPETMSVKKVVIKIATSCLA